MTKDAKFNICCMQSWVGEENSKAPCDKVGHAESWCVPFAAKNFSQQTEIGAALLFISIVLYTEYFLGKPMLS